nr:HEAT repeat domain-containing protein [Gemmatimonadaceae bacterium]
MTSPLPAVPASAADREDPPFPPASVEELVRLLLKAIRAHQLYLPNNPIHKGALDALRVSFAPIWAHVDELVLRVTETELRWYGRPILTEAGKSADSLPWLLFKDGLREVRMSRGFEQEELTRFLDILQRVRKASPDEDDLLTLLWEGDFLLLRYRYVDLAMEPAAPVADGSPEERPRSIDITAITADPEEEATASRPGVIAMSDFDATLYFLDEREIEYLRDAVQLEYQLDQRQNLISVLLDIFEQQAAPEVRDELCDILDSMMVHLLTASRFRNVAYLLRESAIAVQRGESIADEHRERLSGLPDRLSAPGALSQLLQALDDSADLPPQDQLLELFEQLRPAALETTLAWLGRVQNIRLRMLLEQSVSRLAMANTGELVKLIGAGDRGVSIEAIRRAGALKSPAAVGPLTRVLADGDVEHRQASVAALAEIRSTGALQALERGLTDA